ncbi:MAG: hypothetical protein WC967_14785 [Balneolaceae bacterium]
MINDFVSGEAWMYKPEDFVIEQEDSIWYKVFTEDEYKSVKNELVVQEGIGKAFSKKEEACLFAAESAKSEKKDFYIQTNEGEIIVGTRKIEFKNSKQIDKIINQNKKP